MKLIYNTLALLVCVLTLGVFTLRVIYSDGTKFEWIGWIDKFTKRGG